jgi:hypothetical protein
LKKIEKDKGKIMTKKLILTAFFVQIACILSACKSEHEVNLNDKTVKHLIHQHCYEIVDVKHAILSPMLINKCTGETWTAIQMTYDDEKGNPDYSVYTWYKVQTSESVNAFDRSE